jgi:hypothetical protein
MPSTIIKLIPSIKKCKFILNMNMLKMHSVPFNCWQLKTRLNNIK